MSVSYRNNSNIDIFHSLPLTQNKSYQKQRSNSLEPINNKFRNKTLYKKNDKIYNKNCPVLNYLMIHGEGKYSRKTNISDSNPENINYDLTMINKYEEDLNKSLSFISDFDIEQEENKEDSSFNSELDEDDDSIEKIDINIKYRNLRKIKDDENDIDIKLNNDFNEIKKLLSVNKENKEGKL